MITALILSQIDKYIIGFYILMMIAFAITYTSIMSGHNYFKKVFTKSQKEQLDYIVDTYYRIYIIDSKLDDKSKDKVNHDIFQLQNYLMEMARIVGGCAGDVYVKTKMEIMCKK